MVDIRPRDLYTRRAALALTAMTAPALSQQQSHRTNQPGGAKQVGQPVVHFEIGCRDRAKTGQFFGDLFGWKIQQAGPASLIDTATQGRGIPGHITSLGHPPEHYITFYVEVDDVQGYLDKAVALGGKIVVPPVKIPTGTFAWFSDIDGNVIGLIKSS
jgi:uncharacterized protein